MINGRVATVFTVLSQSVISSKCSIMNPEDFYSSYDAAICQQLQFLLNNER